MRLKSKEQPTYQEGETRESLRFAWLPHYVGNVRIWLQKYEVLEVYHIEKIPATLDGMPYVFTIGKWIKATERLIKWVIVG